MKKKTAIFLVVLSMFLLTINKLQAQIDFKKNMKYYEQLCAKRSSFEINKQACLDFEKFKKSDDTAAQRMEQSLSDTKLNADKLVKLIRENDEIVKKKAKEIKLNNEKIINNKKRIAQLDKAVTNSLVSAQYLSDNNQVIDIIMSSTNLEELLLRIDGISAISSANSQNITDLEKTSKGLIDTQRYLSEDINILQKTKVKQKQMLFEFRRKEADIYSKMNSGGTGNFNSDIGKVDLTKIEDNSTNWARPMKHGAVSASTWYYPGGGWHPGIDVANKVGTNITAPANGAILATATTGGGYGKHMVAIFKKNNYVYTMIFGHLSGFVNVNDFKKGQTIAKSGNTGASTGPHVHVEVLRHNTGDVSTVINNFKQRKDYWFGLGYSSKGDCKKVCRLEPASVFKLKMGQNY